jgi:hypothetical protein
MKTKTLISGLAVSLAIVAGPVLADGQLRGAMSAVSNVAGAIQVQNDYNNFKWNNKTTATGPVVNASDAKRHSGFRWATHPNAETNSRTAAVEAGADAAQTASRWIIRNDANQAASRWIIRSDANQAASRWIIRNDADQAASRWIIR